MFTYHLHYNLDNSLLEPLKPIHGLVSVLLCVLTGSAFLPKEQLSIRQHKSRWRIVIACDGVIKDGTVKLSSWEKEKEQLRTQCQSQGLCVLGDGGGGGWWGGGGHMIIFHSSHQYLSSPHLPNLLSSSVYMKPQSQIHSSWKFQLLHRCQVGCCFTASRCRWVQRVWSCLFICFCGNNVTPLRFNGC